MFKLRSLLVVLTAALIAGLWATTAPAQDKEAKKEGDSKAPASDSGTGRGGGERGGRGEGRGGPGGGGNFDPAEMRKRMEERMRENLGASEDEWKVIQPKLEKVMQARMNTMGFGGFGRGMGGGRGPGGGGPGGEGRGGDAGGERPQSETAKASEDLRKALEDKTTGNDVIKAKVEALRAAREKAKAEVVKAQKELKEILTVRQEAQMIAMGMLE